MLAFPILRAEVGGEMHYNVLTIKRGPDGVEIRDVSRMISHAIHLTAIQGGKLVSAEFLQVGFQQSAY